MWRWVVTSRHCVAGERSLGRGIITRVGLTHTRRAKSRRRREKRGFINREDARRSSDTSTDDGEKRAAITIGREWRTHLSHLTLEYQTHESRLKTRRGCFQRAEQRKVFLPMIEQPFASHFYREKPWETFFFFGGEKLKVRLVKNNSVAINLLPTSFLFHFTNLDLVVSTK